MSFYRPGGSGSGSVTTSPISVLEGGTGASTAADARNNLGVTATGQDTNYAYRTNNLSDLNSASTARTNLGLGTIATQNANAVNITGGTIVSIVDLAVADGGTGASTASGALANLLPSYTSNANKVLSVKSDATGVEWTTNGAGTVTSVDLSVPTGLSVSGNPVTSSGTLAVSFAAGYSIPTTTKQGEWDTAYGWGNHASAGYAKYGDTTANFTGTLQNNSHTVLTTASDYLDSADIGTTVQAYDSNLTSFVGTFTLPTTDGTNGQVLKTNGSGTLSFVTAATGTVTSVDMSVPTGFAITGNPVTSSGTLALAFASGYSLPTTTSQSNWDTAYGWGNHASAGYLTSSAIGNTVQGYDADTAKYDDATANFTGTLQKSGNNVLTTASTIEGGTYA
jgi:hypothetical protein